MPDIDVDFCYIRRREVIEYVKKRYGDDHVAQIVTFGTMLARGAVRDVERGHVAIRHAEHAIAHDDGATRLPVLRSNAPEREAVAGHVDEHRPAGVPGEGPPLRAEARGEALGEARAEAPR